MIKQYKPLGVKYHESELRKERELVSAVTPGDKIRAGLMKKLDSDLLHTIDKDQDESQVPKSFGRVFDPFASVSKTEVEKKDE